MTAIRSQVLSKLFSGAVPPLWCPPLTHYTPEGALDQTRIRAHLRFLSQWVGGLLVPGTTGDGWELTLAETRELTEVVLDEVPKLGLKLLWGALHPDAPGARDLVTSALALLRGRQRTEDPALAMSVSGVCGFTVCAPRGVDQLAEVIEKALVDHRLMPEKGYLE